MTPKEIIEGYINLKNYSSSNGWVGFCETSGSYSFELCSQVINDFLNYFSDDIEGSTIIFSLSTWGSVDELIEDYGLSDQQVEILHRLQKLGWLESNMESDHSFNMIEFNSYERSHIYNLLLSIMFIGDVLGSIFILIPSKKLVFYPHEDIGFGVVASDLNDGMATAFLTHMSKNTKLKSYKGGRSTDNTI